MSRVLESYNYNPIKIVTTSTSLVSLSGAGKTCDTFYSYTRAAFGLQQCGEIEQS